MRFTATVVNLTEGVEIGAYGMMDEQKTVSEKLAHRLEKFYSGKVVIGFLMPEENQLTIKMADGSYLVITARTSLDLSVLGDEDVPE